MHPFVVGELLLGGLSAENEALLHSLPWCDPASPEELYDFIRGHHLTGTGVGWVDAALLAATQAVRAQLATYDMPSPVVPATGHRHTPSANRYRLAFATRARHTADASGIAS